MIITNGKIITWEKKNRILGDHSIFIKDELIAEVGLEKNILKKYPGEEILDARGQFILPGNICAHTHFYGAYSRGLAIPGKPPGDFVQILKKLWWQLDKALSADAIYYSALVCMIDAIRHGTTTLIDHHASPNHIEGSLDLIEKAALISGLRVAICYEVTDRDGIEKRNQGVSENIRFIKKHSRQPNTRISSSFGLHSSLTLSEDSLAVCREAAPDGVGFHIHVAEHISDQYDSIEKSSLRVVDRLHRHGILGDKTIAAHCVQIDAREIELLADTGTWVTHQPRSNMNNAVGMADIESMLRAGVRVGLGNDGFSNAMWEEWKATYLAHKLWHLDPRRVSGYDVLDLAIYNNAELATAIFQNKMIGSIVTGSQADLILVDYQPFTPIMPENLAWHILFGFHESMITTTIVGGSILMKDRILLTLDEEEIYHKALEVSASVWKNFST